MTAVRTLVVTILFLVVLAVPSAVLADGRVALVVGNSTYSHIGRLPNPQNDAADMAAALQRLGFEVTTAQDANRASLNEALRVSTRESVGADVALIFYAGHGLEMDGVNYLVPVDARLECDTDVRFETVALDDVLAATAGASLRMVILDACRNNPLARSMQWTVARRSVSGGSFGDLNEDLLGNETLVAYAAAAGTTAADGRGRNSPYTSALLAYLEEPLELSAVFRRVRGRVLESTDGQQRPHEYGSLLRKHYLSRVSTPSPAAVTTADGAAALALSGLLAKGEAVTPARSHRPATTALVLMPSGARTLRSRPAETNTKPNTRAAAATEHAQLPPEILVDRHLVRARRRAANCNLVEAHALVGPRPRAAIRSWQSRFPSTGYLDGALAVPVAASPAAPPLPATQQPPIADALLDATTEIDILSWQFIMISTDPDFEAYLRQFPNGVFSELAKSSLARLHRLPCSESFLSNLPVAVTSFGVFSTRLCARTKARLTPVCIIFGTLLGASIDWQIKRVGRRLCEIDKDRDERQALLEQTLEKVENILADDRDKQLDISIFQGHHRRALEELHQQQKLLEEHMELLTQLWHEPDRLDELQPLLEQLDDPL